MKVTLENTDQIVTLNINGVDVPARLWQGTTSNGVECHAYVTRIAVDKTKDASEFERDLRETTPPRPELMRISDMRLVL